METLELSATKRQETGKQVKKLRAAGQVPGIVYGHGNAPEALTFDARELTKLYSHAGGNKIVTLKVEGGGKANVIFHEVQQDSRNEAIIHVDLYRVRMDEKIKTEIPLHFIGESTAVYQQEGTLTKNLEEVEVEALPGDLPESFEVDITVLDDFEKAIHVSDLKIPANVELLTDPEELICKVEPPRSDEELAELDAEVVEELPEGAEEEGEEVISEESEGNKDKEPKPEE
jgi:large subunit ribosomal protein L25